jgi:Tfp pilus assembly protein PilF
MKPTLIVALAILVLSFPAAAQTQPVTAASEMQLGVEACKNTQYEEAIDHFKKATELDPSLLNAQMYHFQLGQTYFKWGDSTSGFRELSRAVELAPDNYHARIDLANSLVAANYHSGIPVQDALKQAKVHLDILSATQPNNPETHEAWAFYYQAQSNFAAAMQEMEQAIAADPNRSKSYRRLAVFQDLSHLPDQAEANFKKAIEVDPKDMNNQMALGAFYALRGRLPEAEQQYKHAIDIDPKNPEPRAALRFVLMQEGKKD